MKVGGQLYDPCHLSPLGTTNVWAPGQVWTLWGRRKNLLLVLRTEPPPLGRAARSIFGNNIYKSRNINKTKNYGLILHVRLDYDLQSRQSHTPSLQFRKHTFFGLLSLQQSPSLLLLLLLLLY
jgi:hypothetical protein